MSTFYKPSIRPDELYHWKYKDKYRGPSGDWVYIYDDSLGQSNASKESIRPTGLSENNVSNKVRDIAKKIGKELTTPRETTSSGAKFMSNLNKKPYKDVARIIKEKESDPKLRKKQIRIAKKVGYTLYKHIVFGGDIEPSDYWKR